MNIFTCHKVIVIIFFKSCSFADLFHLIYLLGIKTCILTNDFLIDHANRSAASVKATELVAIRHHFDELFQSCQLQLHKPDPEIYKLVCSKMGVDPSEVW